MITSLFSTIASRVAAPARFAPDNSTGAYSNEMNRMLTAAVVSRRFCNLLLTDPQAALRHGYNGESFQLNESERDAILAIHAGDLRDFAAQLVAQVSPEESAELDYRTPRHAYYNEPASGVAQPI
jgi:hypothetical protein